MNPADHVGDAPEAVARNRQILVESLPQPPLWLNQVHGSRVAVVGRDAPGIAADASLSRQAGGVCVVMTADCLPVLFCDREGSVVAAAHAGWRGLAGGVLEATIEAMQVAPASLHAWMGVAIGPEHFEVGEDVRQTFLRQHPAAEAAFTPSLQEGRPLAGKWLADLYALARLRLAAAGVESVHGGGLCSYADAGRFFSFRREKVTGRMASLIWLE